ncbi:hypothetical protein VTN77DRAFT_3315 [Rasamsonia byssochlamydoides]|uniref:uncharacterized protein n=1 Tax=Rasamsonia byssochlamydoides TaxID=89139 RepID=UPI00374284D7
MPPDLNLEIKAVVPRLSEGGLFVKYSRPPGKPDEEIEEAVKAHLMEKPIRPWFNPFDRVGVGRVVGNPWIEDLHRFPSPKLKVEFCPTSPETTATELTQEALYTIFRKYGKLRDIERQQPGLPVTPRYAYIEFTRVKFAVLARSCVHGLTVVEKEGGGKQGTVLKITYERRIKGSWIREWLFSHPRIVIPTLAALIAAITVIIFDPMRTFFIKLKIKYFLNTEDKGFWGWIRKQVRRANILPFGHRKSESNILSAIRDNRKSDIAQLQSWLMESAGTFIVVHGPHGSGTRELVYQALKEHRYKVTIDCKPIQEARGDSATISAAATQVGYRPIFSWMNSISSFIDLASQGIIGMKAGFSDTLDAQLGKIWANTSSALKQIALEERRKDEQDSQSSEEEYLEAHPERRPVVVIDNFLYRTDEKTLLYEKLAQWAAALTTQNIAHVIFLTTDPSYAKSLSKALPNQVFRTISLGDCSLEVGKKFILSYLESESGDTSKPGVLEDLDGCVATLGGCLPDLEFMGRRIKAGESPKSAVNRIIEQSAAEILKIYVLEVDPGTRHWTREQAWYLIKELANADDAVVPYNRILLSELFKETGEATIEALEQAELVTVISVNGRPSAIKPARPVYHTAFRRLTSDKVLRSRLDLAVLSLLIGNENKKISKYEDELQLLGRLHKQPSQLASRVQWVLRKLQDAQMKVDKYEVESAVLDQVLQSER